MPFIRPNIAAPCLPLISATTVHQVGIETCRQNRAAAHRSVAVSGVLAVADAEQRQCAARSSIPPPMSRRVHLRSLVRRMIWSETNPPTMQPSAPPTIDHAGEPAGVLLGQPAGLLQIRRIPLEQHVKQRGPDGHDRAQQPDVGAGEHRGPRESA